MTFSSEEWPKGKLQTVWIWNPGKFPSFCTGVLKMYNFGQIPLAILADWAVFRTFLDFTKMWTRWNFESIFLKIVHQKGLFDAIKENPNFPSCRAILDIYRQWLLKFDFDCYSCISTFLYKAHQQIGSHMVKSSAMVSTKTNSQRCLQGKFIDKRLLPWIETNIESVLL